MSILPRFLRIGIAALVIAGAAQVAAAPASAGSTRLLDLGRLAPTATVNVGLVLRYRNEAELQALVRAQSDPHSPLFRRWLSSAQWNAYFAPEARAASAVAASLRARGFSVDRSSLGRGYLLASAPSAVVERTFATRLHRVAQDGHGVRTLAQWPATIPAELRAPVRAIAGLNGLVADHPGIRHTLPVARAGLVPAPAPAATAAASPKPITTSTPKPNPNPEATLPGGALNIRSHGTVGGGYGPFAIATAYDYPVQHGYGGRGRAVGNVIGVDYSDADLAKYLAEFSIVRTGSTVRVFVDKTAGNDSTGLFESTTDVEAIVGTAPGVTYYEYLIPVLDELEIENAYARIVADNLVDVVNSSFAVCEQQDPAAEYDMDYLAMQGAAKGITFVAATGDGGSTQCAGGSGAAASAQGIAVPSAGYYFTAIGANDLTVDPLLATYVSESGSPTSGGGYSFFEPRPSWQTSLNGTSSAGRNVPDISLQGGTATGGFDIVVQGVDVPESGTSVASALAAAAFVEIDEAQGARNGWVNPRLYAIAAAQGYGFAFRDVVGGSNGLFTAGPGYDNVTGIGSPRVWELAGTL